MIAFHVRGSSCWLCVGAISRKLIAGVFHQSRSQHYPAPTNLVSHSSKSSQNSFLLVISRDPIWIMLRCSPCSGIRLKLTAECQSQAIPFPPSFFLSDFSFYIFFPCPTSFLSRWFFFLRPPSWKSYHIFSSVSQYVSFSNVLMQELYRVSQSTNPVPTIFLFHCKSDKLTRTLNLLIFLTSKYFQSSKCSPCRGKWMTLRVRRSWWS